MGGKVDSKGKGPSTQILFQGLCRWMAGEEVSGQVA